VKHQANNSASSSSWASEGGRGKVMVL